MIDKFPLSQWGRPSPVTSPERGAGARRIALGAQLRRLREDAHVSREDAGRAIRASSSKISRMELGRVRVRERDVTDLLELYGVQDAAQCAHLIDLTRLGNSATWWQSYVDLMPNWFDTYLRLEQAASVLRIYEVQFVPGLFQTREYAREVIRLAYADDAEVDRRVELRMRRQEILTATDGPVVWAVVDESALRRPMARDHLWRAQFDRLMELSELPNVRMQIAPFAVGAHAAAGGPFTILRFAEPDIRDVVYLEQLNSALYLDARADVEFYLELMDRLCTQVPPPSRTREILTDLRAQCVGDGPAPRSAQLGDPG